MACTGEETIAAIVVAAVGGLGAGDADVEEEEAAVVVVVELE